MYTSSDTLEAYQQADDDLGRLVQWTLGSPQDHIQACLWAFQFTQELWEVRFTFTHVCGLNGGTALWLRPSLPVDEYRNTY